MTKKKLLCVVGTRPEAIKMAPVINQLKSSNWATVRVLATAQHREMLDQTLGNFLISPDVDLDVMRPNQDLSSLTARILTLATEVIAREKPDAVLLQGDTTTVLSVALACFYLGIPVGHVEAGLRTGNIRDPFPEELNRVLTSRIATWHFAPTRSALENLLSEGVNEANAIVTGNTVIDALLETSAKIPPDERKSARQVLVTIHRRENFGDPLKRILSAVKICASSNPEITFLFPVHPNPNVYSTVHETLGDLPNVNLIKPLGYAEFVSKMRDSYLILTDSGGVQEEAPALGIPVLVLREETERPEALHIGAAHLLGSNVDAIVAKFEELVTDSVSYSSMANAGSPYGDGTASKQIVDFLEVNV
jgi:UDP-N-acetylglucosamine 2-epimerase (non-hydrolysing)